MGTVTERRGGEQTLQIIRNRGDFYLVVFIQLLTVCWHLFLPACENQLRTSLPNLEFSDIRLVARNSFMVGIFTPQKLSGIANRGSPHPSQLLNLCQHTTAQMCVCIVYILSRYYIPIIQHNLKPAPFMDSLIF